MKKLSIKPGDKFRRLTIIEILDQFNASNKRLVRCICECGNEKIAVLEYLRSGGTQSCGCLQKESSIKNIVKANKVLLETGVTQEPKIATAKRVYRIYADSNLSFADFLNLSQQNCFYCGKPPSNIANTYRSNGKYDYGYRNERMMAGDFIYNGLDRIDNSLPHSKENIVPSCISCNKAKLDRSQEDFFKWIKLIYDHHNDKMI